MVTATKPKPDSIDTSTWLTGNQAVDLLGVSLSTLGVWTRRGLLHPQEATRADSMRVVKVYDPNELARMPRRHRQLPANEAGELTARVFEMLDDGKTMREIVVTTRETFPKIEELREAWLDAGGADVVIGRAAKAELEKYLGEFSTVADLVSILADRFGDVLTKPSEDTTVSPDGEQHYRT